MKRKQSHRIFLSLLLLMLFCSIQGTVLASGNSAGFLDNVDGNMIRGWAWNNQTPDEAVDVHIYIYRGNTGEVLTIIPVRAEQYRSDLAAAGYGNGKHGFSYRIDWNTIPAADIYRVEAYLVNGNDNPRLENPQTFSTKYKIVASLGSFQATAYCPCKSCTWGSGVTCTGVRPQANHTISVDTSKIPLGTKLLINGIVYTAEDRGGGVKGNHVDIFFNSHQEALRYGRKNVQVYIVE